MDDVVKDFHSSDSIIGRNNSFNGEFRTNGLIRIDGDFKGTIKGFGKILIGEKGRFVGDIYGTFITIGGKVKGNVYAMERIDILSTGKLIGDLYTKVCNAEEGMFFSGKANISSDDELNKLFDKNVKNLPPIIEDDF